MNKTPFCFGILFFLLVTPSISIELKNVSPEGLSTAQSGVNEILGFSSNILLSTNDNNYAHHVEVSMAISDDGILFAGWKNSGTHYGGGARVSFARSLDNGNTWSNPYDMPMYDGLFTRQSDPWIYWKNGTLYYAYLEFEAAYLNDPSGDYLTQMTVAKSIDNGESWTPVKATNNTYFADKETIVVDNNDIVYLAYDDVDLETSIVKVTRSVDGGNSYEELSIIGEDEYFLGPYINVNGSNDIFVAWSWVPPGGGNIFFSKSTDKGASFEEPKMINHDGNYSAIEAPGKTTLPLIKFDSFNRLYLVWADKFDQVYDTFDVYLRYSDDSGETWSDRIRVNPSVQGNQWNPDLTIDLDGTLHFVYYHEIDGYYRPYYRTLQFNGTNRDMPIFSDQIVIADAFTSSQFIRPGEYFAIQLDNDNFPHVVWTDGRNNELDIYYARGLTNLPPSNLELIRVIVIIAVIALLSIISIDYYRRVKSGAKLEREKIKLYKKTYMHFCENCQSFTNEANYCETCGTDHSIRKAKSKDYKEYFNKN